MRPRAIFRVGWPSPGSLRFNPAKGYKPDDGGQDVFVHFSAVEGAGLLTLAEGAKVSYEIFTGRSGKVSAENLRVG